MASLHISRSLRQAALFHTRTIPLRTVVASKPGCRRYLSGEAPLPLPADTVAESSEEPPVKKRGRPRKSPPKEPKIKKIKKTPSPPPKKPRLRLQPGEVLPEVTGWELPPLDLWRQYFPVEKVTYLRPAVRKPETAALLAETFVPEGSKDKIIIDACPGPGQLTRELLKLPRERIKKIIVLEPSKLYLKFLQPLEQLDSRVKVYPHHGRDWEAYSHIRASGDLDDVVVHDWKEVHPQLQFIMHMHSSLEGEQLISQLLRCIPDRQWLFKYGRIPLFFVISARIWERASAAEGTLPRCKLSVIAQATAELSQCVDPQLLQPSSDHFHPEALVNFISPVTRSNALESRRMGSALHVVAATPMVEPKIPKGNVEFWDFVLRKLFVQKATSLNRCLNTNALGPGSKNLIPKLSERRKDLLTKDPRTLSVDEWKYIVQVFMDWPFRPEDLGIDAFYEMGSHNR